MGVLVVTGTGTGVGKTVVTAAIAATAAARGLSVAVVKPAQTGVVGDQPGDLAEVARLTGIADLHEFARYPDPLSPAAAARRSGLPPLELVGTARSIDTLAGTRRLVLVEGAGGLLVRYDPDGRTVADLARALGAPLVVVTEPSLGTLNATALTLEAMAHRGLELAGLVLGSWPASPDLAARSNVSDLEMLAARPLSGAIPAGAGQLDPATFQTVARAGLAPAFGGIFDPGVFRERGAIPASTMSTPASTSGGSQ
ncbi:MAG: dethiobiotin synthase [Frankia sp.]